MTIREIAELAGVSTATVSLALNNKVGVGEETRRQILEIAKNGGYNKKITFAKRKILFIKYVGNGAAIEQNGDFIARIIEATENTASLLNYDLGIKSISATEFEEELEKIDFSGFDGAIFLATEAILEHAKLLATIPIPLIAVDNMLEDLDIPTVVMDNQGSIYKAMEYLYRLGHREIGYLGGSIKFSNFIQRAQGYRRGLKKLGLEYKPNYVTLINPTPEGAYRDMSRYLEENKELPTAFVAANDTIAIGAIKALREKGISVPDQVSMIGFDDIPFCMMLDKTLTTIQVKKEKIGEIAVRELNEAIHNPSDDCIKSILRNALIERESVKSLLE